MEPITAPQNRLLAALPRDVYIQTVGRAKRLTLPVGEIISEPGRPAECVYFPTTGVLSAVVTLNNGSLIEAAMIGNEGMAGLAAVIDEHASPYRVIQRVEGEVLRLTAFEFKALLETNIPLRDLVGRYVLTLLQQHAQNAACNLHHKIDERMCRWLLTTADRVGRDVFHVTQEFLSGMLGVSRQSVNVTAGQLQQNGLIAYRRGNMRISERPGLEAAACECYRATKEAYERMMSLAAA
ncbi:MAG: Crp/Fnr family transcriptional regulator [Planctomycetota bacterium]|nr:Crp/Fnr family transcriptional regulator [Planctomycetota bacterium]